MTTMTEYLPTNAQLIAFMIEKIQILSFLENRKDAFEPKVRKIQGIY